MKKVIVLFIAIACIFALLSACSADVNTNTGTQPSSSTGSNSSGDNDQNQTPEQITTKYYHSKFEITLPDYYVKNGNDVFESWGEDRTEIWALDYPLTITEENKYNKKTLEELTNEYIAEQKIEGELVCKNKNCYYILTEGEANGQPWTELSLFYLDDDIFWEIRFYSNSRTWADVQDQWNSYAETIEFN